jgi:hypothetical protein
VPFWGVSQTDGGIIKIFLITFLAKTTFGTGIKLLPPYNENEFNKRHCYETKACYSRHRPDAGIARKQGSLGY